MTEDLKLRAMEPEDLDAIYDIENDMQLWEAGTSNVLFSRYLLHDYIATSSGDIYADKQVRLVMEHEGELVGLVDLANFDPRHQRAEVGIIVRKDCWNRGYAHAAIKRLINYVRTVLHLHQIYAVVDASNQRTLHLFDDCGFQRKAQLQDWLFSGNRYRDAIVMQHFLEKKD